MLLGESWIVTDWAGWLGWLATIPLMLVVVVCVCIDWINNNIIIRCCRTTFWLTGQMPQSSIQLIIISILSIRFNWNCSLPTHAHSVCESFMCAAAITIVGHHFGTTSNKANVNMVNWVTMRNFQSFNCLSTLFFSSWDFVVGNFADRWWLFGKFDGIQNACVCGWVSTIERCVAIVKLFGGHHWPSSLKSSYRSDRWTLTSLPHNCIIPTTLLLSINLLIILGHV